MDWFLIAVTILSLLSSILAWVVKLKWSKEFKEAKEAQISALNEKLNHHKEISSLQLLEYFKESKKQFEENLIDMEEKLEAERKKNRNQVFSKAEYEEQIENFINEKEVLLEEIHSRVKNNLALISGLMQLQTFDSDDEKFKKEIKALQNRIMSIAIVHEKIHTSESLSSIDINDTLNEYLQRFNLEVKFVYKSSIKLNINKSIPLFLFFNELFSLFEENDISKVSLTIKEVSDSVIILVKPSEDIDLNFLTAENNSRFSTTLAKVLVHQINGSLKLNKGVELQFKK